MSEKVQRGAFANGDYVPGDDGRLYWQLSPAERYDVIEAHYAAIRAERKAIDEEALRVARMPHKETRRAYMERVRIDRPGVFERLARAVRLAYAAELAR